MCVGVIQSSQLSTHSSTNDGASSWMLFNNRHVRVSQQVQLIWQPLTLIRSSAEMSVPVSGHCPVRAISFSIMRRSYICPVVFDTTGSCGTSPETINTTRMDTWDSATTCPQSVRTVNVRRLQSRAVYHGII